MLAPLVRRAAVAALLLLAGGCGEEPTRPSLKGSVTANGRPLANKTLVLTLEGEEGVSHSIDIGPEGNFEGEVSKPGTYRVSIAESRSVMEGIDKLRQDGPKVAARYKSSASTDARVAVERGANVRQIELKE